MQQVEFVTLKNASSMVFLSIHCTPGHG